MEKVNIKIGQTTYSDVSVINVDKASGGTANFVYEGITFPYVIKDTLTNYGVTSRLTNNTKLITSIELR